MIRISIFFGVLLASAVANGHHSVAAFYDYETPSELQGTVTSIRWINPHVRFTVETLNDENESEIWTMETGSINMLERQGVSRGIIEVGDQITVAGYTSRHGRKDMIAGYVTTASRENIVLWSGLFGGLASTAPPRETQLRVSGDADAAIAAAQGMFRVWTMGETYSKDTTDEGGDMAVPYRAAALASRAAYDPITDDTGLRCIQQGMPGIMDNPFPIELSEQDGNIVLRTEEWDVVRTFHMGSNENVDGQPATPHGYSVGFWQEGALVVTTKNIDWPYFDDIGTPLGADVETIETFALNADETRLDYSLTVTDSQTFTAPFTLQWPLGLGAGRRDQALQLCSLVSEGITYHALHR